MTIEQLHKKIIFEYKINASSQEEFLRKSEALMKDLQDFGEAMQKDVVRAVMDKDDETDDNS